MEADGGRILYLGRVVPESAAMTVGALLWTQVRMKLIVRMQAIQKLPLSHYEIVVGK